MNKSFIAVFANYMNTSFALVNTFMKGAPELRLG